ncbi:hypothetical protein Vau01_097700 [Virgisporangium aurantiacum]|uniref:Uncharacterized protein n=1 Tax=Virgisporangium aurantiacum TaxID=175570 RepID=A0A8J3ZDM1_9ACTN|nr:hypothetical protein Vau01_097700 [Virgisporangium aurantiacum]
MATTATAPTICAIELITSRLAIGDSHHGAMPGIALSLADRLAGLQHPIEGLRSTEPGWSNRRAAPALPARIAVERLDPLSAVGRCIPGFRDVDPFPDHQSVA